MNGRCLGTSAADAGRWGRPLDGLWGRRANPQGGLRPWTWWNDRRRGERDVPVKR
jgi:hypothetical protein